METEVRTRLFRVGAICIGVGAVMVVLGLAIVTGSPGNCLWPAIVPLAFHLRVTFYEEGEMARTFGEEWEHYRRAVPRWGARLSPYESE